MHKAGNNNNNNIFFLYSLDTIHIKPYESDHPKIKDLVVAYENRGASSKKRSQHMYFLEDCLLHVISRLCISMVPCCH